MAITSLSPLIKRKAFKKKKKRLENFLAIQEQDRPKKRKGKQLVIAINC